MALDFAKLGAGQDGLAAFAVSPEQFELTRNTINLRVGRSIPFKGMINGQKVNAFATLNSAKLTRLSLLRQSYTSGSMLESGDSEYYIVTGQFNPVSIDITIDNDGEIIPLHEVWRHMTNALGNTDHSSDAWMANLTRLGLNYVANPFQLYFQQMGADPDKIEKTFNTFRDLGAYDDTATMAKNSQDPNRPQRMERCLIVDQSIDVSFFELGQVNRDKVKSGQGFIDLVDAMSGQLNRVTKLRHDAAIIERELEVNKDEMTAKQITKMEEKIKSLRQQSSQFHTSWSGAQQNTQTNKITGELEWLDRWSPTQAPCGRFDLVVDNQTINIDLWKNANQPVKNETSVPSLKNISEEENILGED
jgi:hypothetical protein